jgi:3-deoxy-8-phosphooctulonate synthase
MKTIKVGNIKIANNLPLVFIGGTCVIESRENYLKTAKKLKSLVKENFILKASFDKANRSTLQAFRGPGIDDGLNILEEAKNTFKLPVLTDIHEPWQAEVAAEVADILQIPAFLCRQTDLLIAAARTGKIINIKKGQFLAPQAITHAIKKIEACGNTNILLTERGSCFGYGDLVVDMRSLEIMKKTGYPVIFDLTHSMQKPTGLERTGGDKSFAMALGRSASALGIAGIFFEAHEDPSKALSDSANSLDFKEVKTLLEQTRQIDNLVKKWKKI